MTLTQEDKDWIQQNVNGGERPYQGTYMVGPINFTVRLPKEEDVVPSLERMVKQARESKELTAKVNIMPTKKSVEYVEGVVCPECGSKVIKRVSKSGKEFHECENRKYDFKTKQTSGCTYINWL